MQKHFCRRFFLLACCAVLLVGIMPTWAASALTREELGYTPITELVQKGEKNITFQDASLAGYMKSEYADLQNSDGSFPIAKLNQIDFISIWCYKPMDLSEFQLFTNLGGLCIYEAPEVTGVLALSQCKELDYLSFDHVTQINMAEVVKAVPKTESVSFGNCGELDYAAIAGWKNLTSVSLQGKFITDLSYLAEVPGLAYLYFSEVINADFTSCGDISGLDTLTFNENATLQDPATWALIANNPKLTNLTLGTEWSSDKYDFDDSVFQNLKGLTSLDITGAVIEKADFIKNCSKLKTLVIENCSFASTDFESLSSLKKVEELVLCNVGLTDLSFVKGMKLSMLWLDDNGLTDVAPLTGAKQIKKLSLRGNAIEDCAPLAKIKGLKKLFYNGEAELPKLKGVEVERGQSSWWAESEAWESLWQ